MHVPYRALHFVYVYICVFLPTGEGSEGWGGAVRAEAALYRHNLALVEVCIVAALHKVV